MSQRTTAGEYEIELLATDLATGFTELTFEIRRDDGPVSQLEPYLGALGHLVALREGDVAYLHVHPGGDESRQRPDPIRCAVLDFWSIPLIPSIETER